MGIELCLPLLVVQHRLPVARCTDMIRATVKGRLVVALWDGLIYAFVFLSFSIGGPLFRTLCKIFADVPGDTAKFWPCQTSLPKRAPPQ